MAIYKIYATLKIDKPFFNIRIVFVMARTLIKNISANSISRLGAKSIHFFDFDNFYAYIFGNKRKIYLKKAWDFLHDFWIGLIDFAT